MSFSLSHSLALSHSLTGLFLLLILNQASVQLSGPVALVWLRRPSFVICAFVDWANPTVKEVERSSTQSIDGQANWLDQTNYTSVSYLDSLEILVSCLFYLITVCQSTNLCRHRLDGRRKFSSLGLETY